MQFKFFIFTISLLFFSSCKKFPSNYNKNEKKRQTIAIIISGPSGVGKTTIIDKLEENYNFYKVISFTSRDRRNGEVKGIDYNFINKDQCNEIKKLPLLDFAENYDNCYGILSSQVEAALNENQDLLFNISSSGLRSIANNNLTMKDVKIVSIFLDVDKDILKKRLEKRSNLTKENQDLINKRFENYENERKDIHLYSYVIDANQSIDTVYKQIEEIYLKYAN